MNVLKIFLGVMLVSVSVRADNEEVKTGAELLDQIKPALVRVQYYLKYHDNVCPDVAGYWCGNCGRYHRTSAEENIIFNRPVEAPGYLTADRKVITPDLYIQKRYLREVKVCNEGGAVEAEISGYCVKEKAVELTLSEKLKGAQPLKFTTAPQSPLFNVSFSDEDGFWKTSICPFSLSGMIYSYETNEKYYLCKGSSMVVDKAGAAVAFTTFPRVSVKNRWKVSPESWQKYSASQFDELMKKVKGQVNNGIYMVKLVLRDHKKLGSLDEMDDFDDDFEDDFGEDFGEDEFGDDFEEPEDEFEALEEQVKVTHDFFTKGFLVENRQLVIPAKLNREAIELLEKIVLIKADGTEVPVTFKGAFKHFKIILAEVDKGHTVDALTLSDKELVADHFLPTIALLKSGEELVSYSNYTRAEKFNITCNNYRSPEFEVELNEKAYVFNADCELAAFPVMIRNFQQDRWSSDEEVVLQAVYLKKLLEKPEEHIDHSLIPVKEGEERTAFFGVEVQRLDRELAKLNRVHHLLRNGFSGAYVNYVYKNSTADKIGMKAGDIILKIALGEGQKPLQVDLDAYYQEEFPWSRLDEVPEQFFDRIPSPWQKIETKLNKLLTRIGISHELEITYMQKGKVFTRSFTVAASPEHFGNAGKYKDKTVGYTVKNMTFEVRRYFRVDDTAPGVVVAAVNAGSRASTAGIKPYEVVTHVNGVKVHNVEAFKKLTLNKDVLQLTIKRMTKSRIVKLKL